ncbi:MAG: pantoate--beta-alanine ligase [Phocaeicola sp.]|nr:pantoate--beta-alanine ligase [Phocaeicola sp.]MDD7449311.1 pantoate--beta-alanine ligase [Prevotellaceae bacterium]MDY5938522.1 pantoate--beta-alanine ligase [Phocaeicola sp.]
MKVITSSEELKKALLPHYDSKKFIGLVPTMGALHQGHLSLVEKATSENDITVISIFVNPTQFNDPEDLKKYPRTLEADLALLEKANVDIVFAPTVEDVYPTKDTRIFSYPPLDEVMEGKARPGHFNGVCQIVSKLFTLTNPTRAYFGEKDFQQLAIIREMVRTYPFQIEIVGCPIMREKDGLAMSSRNMRLTPIQRTQALNISKTLFSAKEKVDTYTLPSLKVWVENEIKSSEGLDLDYFEIIDGNTLQPIENWQDASYIVGCITVFCGEVRLIDNITLKNNK